MCSMSVEVLTDLKARVIGSIDLQVFPNVVQHVVQHVAQCEDALAGRNDLLRSTLVQTVAVKKKHYNKVFCAIFYSNNCQRIGNESYRRQLNVKSHTQHKLGAQMCSVNGNKQTTKTKCYNSSTSVKVRQLACSREVGQSG